jgi:hypothetical protein
MKSIIFYTTFIVFLIEAIIHFNIGKKTQRLQNTFKIYFPETKDLLKIVFFVFVFSYINAHVAHYIITLKKK